MPYPDDPALRAGTIELLGTVWPGLPHAIGRARAWGADWFEHSEPFVEIDAGTAVAHVGVISISVILEGRGRRLAGIHAVCTRADRRGQGHLRRLMARALAWVDARDETAVLWANDAAIYARFGFDIVTESVFRGPITEAPLPAPVRALALDDAEDVGFLVAHLARRAPVSTRCGVTEPGWLALINLALWPAPGPTLAFLPDLDAIVVHDRRGAVLRIHDVIAAKMPTLGAITARIGAGASSVEVFFAPDALAAPELSAAPGPVEDPFMVRSALPAGAMPFAFSPLAHC